MSKTLIRLAPSQAGGRSLSGAVIGGGKVVASGIAVLPASNVGPFSPAVTVPQFAGAMPGKDVIVQQVTRPRTKKKPPTARSTPATMKIICAIARRPSLMFLRKFILFIQV